MRKVLSVGMSVTVAAMLTLATVVATLLYLMFSTDSDKAGRHEAMFGSIFFETQEKTGGAIGVTMGVEKPTALIVMFFVFAVIMTITQITYRRLKQRRIQPTKEMSTN